MSLLLVRHLKNNQKHLDPEKGVSPDHPLPVKFKNGKAVSLDRNDETDSWYIRWTLFLNIY
jgi:hypothetical protein